MDSHERETPSRLLTVREIADRLRISVRAVFQHIAAGSLTRLKLGHRTTRILESDLEEFIDNLRAPEQKGKSSRHRR